MANHRLLKRIKENPAIQSQLRSCSHEICIPLRLQGTRGEIVWWGDVPKRKALFCQTLRSNIESARACRTAHNRAVQESLRWGEATITTCCHFLMQITTPVMDHGRLVGALVASPFLFVNPSELEHEELAFIRREHPEKRRRLKEALSLIPVVKEYEATQTANKLFELADQLSVPNLTCLLKIREIQEIQGKIADQILDLKMLNKEFNPSSLTKLSYSEEKGIITKIRLGDREGAKEILHRLLAITLSQYLENFELLKIYVLEIIIVLSRAAVEAGCRTEDMLGMKYQFINELGKIKDQEHLCLWVLKMLEKLIDSIYQTRNVKNYQRLKEALDFIEANYSHPLKVEHIARVVHLSPSRLSHIIKDELGTTLTDYISKIRIDKAKTLLKETEMPISYIALEVGYPDQSYFTKIFKKVEKCTPNTFRNNSSQPVGKSVI